MMDMAALPEDEVELVVQAEAGQPGKMKVYVNVNGECAFRMCKVARLTIAGVPHQDSTVAMGQGT
jgi:hypothetical protein